MLFLTLSLFSEDSSAQGANTRKATVTAEQLNIRETPSTTAKIVGKLKNNSAVTVYSVNKNGWAKIKYKKKTAYISAHYIKYTKQYVSYKRNKNYTYKYKYYYDYDSYMYFVSYSKPITYVKTTAKGDYWSDGSIWKETASGLKITVNKYSPHFNVTATYLKYPLKKDTIFYNKSAVGFKEEYRINATNKTLKIGKKSWNNSTQLLVYGKDLSYQFHFAPGAGIIQRQSHNSQISELIMYKKK